MSLKHKAPEWKARKEEFFIKHKRSCAVCKTNHNITLHHLNYDYEMGKEPDAVLMPLCQKHHSEVHEYATLIGYHFSLEEATIIYMRMMGAGGNPLRKPRKRSQQKRLRKRVGRAPRQYTTKEKFANNTLKARSKTRTNRKRVISKR